MVKINIVHDGISGKVQPDHYYKFINALMLDRSNNWYQTRYGIVSGYNPSVSPLTKITKGKDSPLIDRGQLRMSQRVEDNGDGKFLIGTDKKYGAIVMKGGTFTAKKSFVIPCTKEAKSLLQRLQKIKAVVADLRTKYSYSKNKSNIFIGKKGVFLITGINSKNSQGKKWTTLYLFRKTIKLPKRNILFFSEQDKQFIKNGVKFYFGNQQS
jgi:phage gpG-like protein